MLPANSVIASLVRLCDVMSGVKYLPEGGSLGDEPIQQSESA
jgi:hypothetical protein